MATVYKAYHPKLDRYVALKMMHASFLNDPNFTTRFEREAQIIGRLDHPHIVPVYDYAEFNGYPYLVMKLIEGISLHDALGDGPLELRDTTALFPLIASALDYAHQQGVLHRDIKPSNVMLDKLSTPYLADFGLARTVQAGQSSLSAGNLIGTPAYMSPEQASGASDLDSRSDLYSLGVVLYELIIGKLPFAGATTYAVLHQHIAEPVPTPTSINPEIPPPVEWVILRALSKDPDDRYATALEMSNALRDALDQSQVRQLNDGSRHTIILSLAKPREASKPLVGLPLTPAIAPASFPSPIPAPVVSQPIAPPAPARANRTPVLAALGVGLIAAAIIITVLIGQGSNRPAEATPTAVALIIADANSPQAAGVVQTPEAGAPSGPNGEPPGGQQPGGAAPQQGGGRIELRVAGVEPYEIAPLNLQQAEAAVVQNAEDPSAYLAVIQAQLAVRGGNGDLMPTVEQGLNHGDTDRYVLTAAQLFLDSGAPPDTKFEALNLLLQSTENADLRTAIHSASGQHLYNLVSNPDRVPAFLTARMSNSINEGYEPLFRILLARLLVSRNQLDLAQAALERVDGDSAEAQLIYGDLYAAQGDDERARQAWQAARDFADAPVWVQQTADAALQ